MRTVACRRRGGRASARRTRGPRPPGQSELSIRRHVGHAHRQGRRRVGPELRRPAAACTTRAARTSRSTTTRTRRSRTRSCWPTARSRSTRTPRRTTSTRTASARRPSRRAWAPSPSGSSSRKSSRFEWHDHRAHWMGKADPPNLKDKDVKTKIDDWTVPIEVAGTKGDDRGHADAGSRSTRAASRWRRSSPSRRC